MLGQIGATFSITDESTNADGAFFSVASTTPFVAVPSAHARHDAAARESLFRSVGTVTYL